MFAHLAGTLIPPLSVAEKKPQWRFFGHMSDFTLDALPVAFSAVRFASLNSNLHWGTRFDGCDGQTAFQMDRGV